MSAEAKACQFTMAFVRLDRYELFTVVALALVIVTAVVVRFAQSQRRTALYDGVPIAGDFEKQRNYEAASEQFGSQGFKVVHDGLKEVGFRPAPLVHI